MRLLQLHIGGDLVHGHMARTLHHHLHILGPGPLGQLSQTHQLLDLANIAAVRQAAGPAGVSQGDGHVVLPADLQNLIKVLVEGVLLPGHAHPGKHQGAAPGHNIHLPLVLLNLLDGLAGDAAVKGYKIHAVLRVQPDHVQKILGRQRSQDPAGSGSRCRRPAPCRSWPGTPGSASAGMAGYFRGRTGP